MERIKILRTPDSRFENLKDFPYEPHYVDSLPGYEGLRSHYLDLGPKDASHTFLCLHGAPTWSYLFRKMIPQMVESGARVVAPDLFGFGRSDKPVNDSDYSFHFHRNFLLRFVEHLNLKNITLVVHDWGATIGLTLPVDNKFRSVLKRLLLMNTLMPTGKPLGPHYYEWRDLVRKTSFIPSGDWIAHLAPHMTPEEIAGYNAPYPDRSFQAGARIFPELAMTSPDMDGFAEAMAAIEFWKNEWAGESFCAIGAKDPDLDAMLDLSKIVGCSKPMILTEVTHFTPEWGETVIDAALKAFNGAA